MSDKHHKGSPMKHENETPDFFDKPENVKLILRVFYVLSGLLVLIDFVYPRHTEHPWEKIPAFYCIRIRSLRDPGIDRQPNAKTGYARGGLLRCRVTSRRS